jgi:hypothetical protein
MIQAMSIGAKVTHTRLQVLRTTKVPPPGGTTQNGLTLKTAPLPHVWKHKVLHGSPRLARNGAPVTTRIRVNIEYCPKH